MSFNGGGDQLARGAKSAVFKQAAFDKDGRNSHGQTWDDIFPTKKRKSKPKRNSSASNPKQFSQLNKPAPFDQEHNGDCEKQRENYEDSEDDKLRNFKNFL
jgi:hypothetical protein